MAPTERKFVRGCLLGTERASAYKTSLLALISRATGHALSIGVPTAEEGEEVSGALAHNSGLDAETE